MSNKKVEQFKKHKVLGSKYCQINDKGNIIYIYSVELKDGQYICSVKSTSNARSEPFIIPKFRLRKKTNRVPPEILDNPVITDLINEDYIVLDKQSFEKESFGDEIPLVLLNDKVKIDKSFSKRISIIASKDKAIYEVYSDVTYVSENAGKINNYFVLGKKTPQSISEYFAHDKDIIVTKPRLTDKIYIDSNRVLQEKDDSVEIIKKSPAQEFDI